MKQRPDRPAHLPSDWSAALGDLIGALGSVRFPAALRRFLQLWCPFDSLVVTRYSGMAPPQAIYDDLDDVQSAISVEFYATGPYLLDPFYQACRNSIAEGAYRLRDLAPKSFFRSQYYRSFYRKIRIGDEIGLLINDGTDRWIVLSLGRRLRKEVFSEEEASRLNAAFRVVASAVLRQWGETSPESDANAPGDFEDQIATFGADVLSPREAEVVQLILRGHSTPTVADALGISPGTVKVHRRHAYAKLNVSSQSRLFALASRHLLSRDK